MDDDEKESRYRTPLVISLLFSLWEDVIWLVEHHTFHSLIWSGDEQGYIAKSRCLEIYQTFEEKWKITEVCESKIRLQEIQW